MKAIKIENMTVLYHAKTLTPLVLNVFTVLESEVESLRTSLASRTHFDVLGLEASSPRKLPCPRLEDSSIF